MVLSSLHNNTSVCSSLVISGNCKPTAPALLLPLWCITAALFANLLADFLCLLILLFCGFMFDIEIGPQVFPHPQTTFNSTSLFLSSLLSITLFDRCFTGTMTIKYILLIIDIIQYNAMFFKLPWFVMV